MTDHELPVLPVAMPSSVTTTPPKPTAVGSSVHATPRSPWLTFWRHPRWTIRDVVADRPERFTLLLAALMGFVLLEPADIRLANAGELYSTWASLTLVPLLGLLLFALRRFVITHVGHWLGGAGSAKAVGAAVAWAWLPLVVTALWHLVAVSAAVALASDPPLVVGAVATAIEKAMSATTGFVDLATVVAVIVSLVLEVNLVATVHDFSRWRATIASSSTLVALWFALTAARAAVSMLR